MEQSLLAEKLFKFNNSLTPEKNTHTLSFSVHGKKEGNAVYVYINMKKWW